MTEKPLVGVFYGMSNEDYHAHPALSSSGLKLLARTPAHYYAAYLDPEREPRVRTAAMRLGSITHSAVLEPHTFDERFVVLPEGLNRRTNEGKALWAEIEASGKEPMTDDELKKIKKMAAAAHRHPTMQALFGRFHAKTEVSIFWVDPETGVNLKVRPDIMTKPYKVAPNGFICDLKTCQDASEAEFPRQAWNLDMHLAAALYPMGYMAAHGTSEPPEFLWLAQEKTAPYANQIFPCTQELSEYGMLEVRRLLEIYAECREANHWPAYGTGLAKMEMPGWASKTITEALEGAGEIAYV